MKYAMSLSRFDAPQSAEEARKCIDQAPVCPLMKERVEPRIASPLAAPLPPC
jgi:hypothetical protein